MTNLEKVKGSLEQHLVRHYEVIEKFKAKISEADGHEVSYHLSWNAEEVVYSGCVVKYLNQVADSVSESTDECVSNVLVELREELAKDILERNGYRHNSTSAMHNIENMCDFRAKQSVYEMLEKLWLRINPDKDRMEKI